MDELIFSGELTSTTEDMPFLMATISDVGSDGFTLSINGGLSSLKKKYSRLQTGDQLSKGDRVLVVKISGTYVILGKIGI